MTNLEQAGIEQEVVAAAKQDAQKKGWFGLDGLSQLFKGKKNDEQPVSEPTSAPQNPDQETW